MCVCVYLLFKCMYFIVHLVNTDGIILNLVWLNAIQSVFILTIIIICIWSILGIWLCSCTFNVI